MNAATRRKPKSRFSRTPVTSLDGTAKVVPPHRLTEQDLEILKALAHRRFLSVDYIAALVGTSYKYALARIQILKSAPNFYIKVCDAQHENPKLYLYIPLFYELDQRGIGELRERDIFIPSRRPVKNIVHAVMAEQIMTSFELGARGGVSLINRADILAKAPQRTRELSNPDSIPIGEDHSVRPDGEMFVLKNNEGFFFFPGIEADTGTEQLHSYDYARSSITRKFTEYITILEKEIYKTHFGAKTFFIPFITASERRLTSMMELLEEMTEKKPSLRKHFLFKTHPLFTSSTKSRPTGHMITEEWRRVGAPPLTFIGSS